MGQDIVCPVLTAKAEEEVKVETSKTTPPIEEGSMTIGTTVISGFRTYSIILMVMAVYCYLALKGGKIEPMQDLAFMICGYLFGAKVTKR
jgi:hypothetical protein